LARRATPLFAAPARAGGVIGAAVAAGVSYYMTATALAALAEERALRREEPSAAHGKHSGRHGHAKHAPATPGGVGASTPSKHKHAKASEQARRAVASAAEQAARAGGRDDDDDDDDGMGEEDGAASEETLATPTPAGMDGEDGAGGAGVVNNPVYQQRVMADEAMPSRAAQRFTALGQTPDTPAPGSAMYGQYGAEGDEDASAEDAEFADTVSGLETGLETEEDSGARRRRGSVGGAGLRVVGRCSTAITADQRACRALRCPAPYVCIVCGGSSVSDGTPSRLRCALTDGPSGGDNAPMMLTPSSRASPKRCSTAGMDMSGIVAWSLNSGIPPPPGSLAPSGAAAQTGAPASGGVSRTTSGAASSAGGMPPNAKASAGAAAVFRVRGAPSARHASGALNCSAQPCDADACGACALRCVALRCAALLRCVRACAAFLRPGRRGWAAAAAAGLRQRRVPVALPCVCAAAGRAAARLAGDAPHTPRRACMRARTHAAPDAHLVVPLPRARRMSATAASTTA
jgi:hypothetical protein